MTADGSIFWVCATAGAARDMMPTASMAGAAKATPRADLPARIRIPPLGPAGNVGEEDCGHVTRHGCFTLQDGCRPLATTASFVRVWRRGLPLGCGPCIRSRE